MWKPDPDPEKFENRVRIRIRIQAKIPNSTGSETLIVWYNLYFVNAITFNDMEKSEHLYFRYKIPGWKSKGGTKSLMHIDRVAFRLVVANEQYFETDNVIALLQRIQTQPILFLP